MPVVPHVLCSHPRSSNFDLRAANDTRRLHGAGLEPSLSCFSILFYPNDAARKQPLALRTFRSWMVKGSS